MKISPCNSYHALVEDCQILRKDDAQSVFKVYFCSITGRATPERFEWAHCQQSKQDFLDNLQKSNFEGIGFVTAFPHIAKIFLYAPQNEILQYVSAFKPTSGECAPLQRENNFLEFACLAEAVIAAQEFNFWAESDSVAEYLSRIGQFAPLSIVRNDKLQQYWRSC
ncbi:MAG: hypothetical protein GX564_03065 [Oligosphaeraceae bacterium]|nr:hypothetical protein [Oligosphaeraceae bacterium]